MKLNVYTKYDGVGGGGGGWGGTGVSEFFLNLNRIYRYKAKSLDHEICHSDLQIV